MTQLYLKAKFIISPLGIVIKFITFTLLDYQPLLIKMFYTVKNKQNRRARGTIFGTNYSHDNKLEL